MKNIKARRLYDYANEHRGERGISRAKCLARRIERRTARMATLA